MKKEDLQGIVLTSSLISIVLSIMLFATGKRETGIFIGLWAPTIMGLGNFFHVTGGEEQVKQLQEKMS
jgi:hypothetical protein